MRSKKKIIAAAVSAFCFVQMMSITAYASGDVAGAGDKHLDYSKSTGRFSRKQCGVSRDRRYTCSSAVCEDNTRIPRLSQTRSA